MFVRVIVVSHSAIYHKRIEGCPTSLHVYQTKLCITSWTVNDTKVYKLQLVTAKVAKQDIVVPHT